MSESKIDVSKIPENLLEAVKAIAAGQGVVLNAPSDYARYILEDEDAQEIVLPYLS